MAPQIPHPSTALHLYRHLLRQTTYLPPLARPWAAERIQARFRDLRNTPEPRPHISNAHRQLRYLRAANAGHANRMVRICHLASGRLGKRRRQLATAHLAKGPPADTAELCKDNSQDASSQRTWLDNWNLDKIKALGISQSLQDSNFPLSIRRNIDPNQALVTTNCWGLTVKPAQLTHKHQKHYARILATLLPPLPQGEWDTLQSLSLGGPTGSMWKIPPRRPVAQTLDEDTRDDTQWWKYASQPARKVERGSSRRFMLLSGRTRDDGHRAPGPPIGVATYKPRFLRRSIYGRVWAASPTMREEQIKGKSRWAITWGGRELKAPSPTSSDLHFFQDMDKQESPSAGVGPI
jgi:hypothetical protein